MLQRHAFSRLDSVYENAPVIKLTDDDRYVVFSDLHMGNGGLRDDFNHNAPRFKYVLDNYYTKKDFNVVLNGDIEELHKFLIRSIARKWEKVYDSFRALEDSSALYKVLGNHDSERWLLGGRFPLSSEPRSSLKLNYKGNDILVFHGHQAGRRQDGLETVVHLLLRYAARPIAFNNLSPSHNSQKRYLIERRTYDYARSKRIMAVIGHTHRPLFESMSKVDFLKFKLEQLLREHTKSSSTQRQELERRIFVYKSELETTLKKGNRMDLDGSIYNEGPMVPCLFNSGCCIGKRGFTAIEFSGGQVSLVHWFDSNLSDKYFGFNGYSPERLDGSSLYRLVLKSDDLDYIFTRIKLLA